MPRRALKISSLLISQCGTVQKNNKKKLLSNPPILQPITMILRSFSNFDSFDQIYVWLKNALSCTFWHSNSPNFFSGGGFPAPPCYDFVPRMFSANSTVKSSVSSLHWKIIMKEPNVWFSSMNFKWMGLIFPQVYRARLTLGSFVCAQKIKVHEKILAPSIPPNAPLWSVSRYACGACHIEKMKGNERNKISVFQSVSCVQWNFMLTERIWVLAFGYVWAQFKDIVEKW